MNIDFTRAELVALLQFLDRTTMRASEAESFFKLVNKIKGGLDSGEEVNPESESVSGEVEVK